MKFGVEVEVLGSGTRAPKLRPRRRAVRVRGMMEKARRKFAWRSG